MPGACRLVSETVAVSRVVRSRVCSLRRWSGPPGFSKRQENCQLMGCVNVQRLMMLRYNHFLISVTGYDLTGTLEEQLEEVRSVVFLANWSGHF